MYVCMYEDYKVGKARDDRVRGQILTLATGLCPYYTTNNVKLRNNIVQ